MPAEKAAGEGGGLFEHQPDRSGKRPASFLGGFTGYLVTNGYTGYNRVLGVTYCGCRTHARWKWRDAMPDDTTAKISKAAVGYRHCTKLRIPAAGAEPPALLWQNAVPRHFGASDALESLHKTAKIHGDI